MRNVLSGSVVSENVLKSYDHQCIGKYFCTYLCVYLQEDIVIMANPIGESSWPFSVSAATSQGNFVEHVFIQLIDERKVQND